MGRLESVPLPDSESASAALDAAFSALTSEEARQVAGLLGGVAAAGSGAATGVAIPFVVRALAGRKVVELGEGVDRRLNEYVRGLDGDDRKEAALGRLAQGVSLFLPDGDALREASMQAGEGDPEALLALLEEYDEDEDKRRELDRAVERFLSGDVAVDGEEDFVGSLQEAFGTETRDEALALFYEFQDLLESRAVHETLDAVEDVAESVEAVREELNHTRADLRNRIGDVIRANLRNEGFVRLHPDYFERKAPASRETVWRQKFKLEDVKAGYALDRERVVEGERRNVTGELLERLGNGENQVVVGGPGVGKSTVLKQVAVRWYVHQRGTVLYRESGRRGAFENVGPLVDQLEEAEGHALVVVEDVVREGLDVVLEVMEEFAGDPTVTFLFDSRRRDWEQRDEETADAGQSLQLGRDLTMFECPGLDEEECRRLVRHFEREADVDVGPSPADLLADIREEATGELATDATAVPGETFLLFHRLSLYADPMGLFGDEDSRTTLADDVEATYERLAAEGGDRAVNVGILVNLLNGSGVGVYPDLVHALAEDDLDDHEAVADALELLEGHVIFERADSDTENPDADPDEQAPEPPYRGIHPLWSVTFLEHLLSVAANEAYAAARFGQCVTAMLSLADDVELRSSVQGRPDGSDGGYADRIEADPEGETDALVTEVFDLGQEYPRLAPLYGTSEDPEIELPAACSDEMELRRTNWLGEIYSRGGFLERAEAEYRALEAFGDDADTERAKRWRATGLGNLGLVAQQRGDLDEAADYHHESLTILREVGDRHGEAQSLGNLGLVARKRGDLDEAADYHNESLTIEREVGDRHGEAASLNNLGNVARQRGDLDEAADYFNESLTINREVGDRHGEARSLNNLGAVALQRGDLDEAADYHRESLTIKREVGDRHGEAKSLGNLGLVARERDELESARDYFESEAKIHLDVGALRDAVTAIDNLLDVCEELGDETTADRWRERRQALLDEAPNDLLDESDG